jgi:cytochrome P450
MHIHIHDPAYFDTIYASGSTHKRNKCSYWHHAGSVTMAGSMLEALSHDLHKTRRTAVANFFSKRSVASLEPIVVARVQELLERLLTETGPRIVNLNNAYAAMTMDVISAYCFGTSLASLSRPQYGKEWLDMLHSGIQMRPLGRQFPWLINTLLDLPPHIVEKVDPGMARVNTWTRQMVPKIEAILAGEKADQKTIFHEIRDGGLSAEEKKPERLMAEAHVILGAGTETTARTLAVTTYYLLKNKDQGEKLRQELKTVLREKDSVVSLPLLEALPFLVSHITSRDAHILPTNNTVRRHQRRPPRRAWRLLAPATHRHARGSSIQAMDHPTRHACHAIPLPPTHRCKHFPRPVYIPPAALAGQSRPQAQFVRI